ncbi:MAG: putative toxin-antitoxin system toxin component, PIN family [Anaerolineales bacterium]|nr:putative toxin-antitoxin system toxin component, PIN family [Anaerolineales bacterium]
MLRIVIDTNILVSALLSKKGVPSQILDAWRERKFLVVTSEAAILETERVLNELKATGKYALSDEDIAAVLNLLRKDALIVPGTADTRGTIPADPDDEKFLSIALDGEADIIISGDRHLLDLGNFQNISIQTARHFLDSIQKESS